MPLKDYAADYPGLVSRLLASRLAGRLAQGYLCIGDHAESLLGFANAWIQAVACLSPATDGDACGSCDNCRRFQSKLYPEFYVVRPVSKARMIQVEQMHELMSNLSLTAGPRRKKVGLILDADCMGVQAQNAFLKTLEEPDPDTLILLCTTQPRQLLPTIRSRCQVLTLLKNVCSHDDAIDKGVFSALAPLVPGVPPEAALLASARIQAAFAVLEAEAKDWVSEHRDPRWLAAEKSDDKKSRDDAKKQEEAAISAEYLRRRAAMLEAIQTWYHQAELLARGLPAAACPCPELLAGVVRPPEMPVEALPQVQRALAIFSICLSSNAKEELAIDAFCLEVARAGVLA